jgi:hypothetical protein
MNSTIQHPRASSATTQNISATVPTSSATPDSSATRPFVSSPSSCKNCDKLTDILSSTVQDMAELHSLANTMATSSEVQWNLDMRRTSIFHSLHQTAELSTANLVNHTALALGELETSLAEVDAETDGDVANVWVSDNESARPEKDWSSASDGKIEGDSSARVEEDWASASDEKVGGNTAVDGDENSSEDVADTWESDTPADEGDEIKVGSDQDSVGLEDVWTSGSDEMVEGLTTKDKDRSVAGEDDEDADADSDVFSSQPSSNSHLVVLESRITLDGSRRSFPLSDAWPNMDNSNVVSPPPTWSAAPRPYRLYVPEDFSNLQEHMFEDRESDSEPDDLYV